MTSSHEVILKMRRGLDTIEKILRDGSLTTDVQISDVGTLCWGIVQGCCVLQRAVGDELWGLDE